MKKDKPTHVLEVMQRIADRGYFALISLGELLYHIRELILLAVMMISVKCEIPVRGAFLVSLFLLWLCLTLRQAHREHKRLKRIKKSDKRFTYLDKDGNPSIRIEDLQEIVEYLYRLEEQNEGIPRTYKE